VAFQLKKDLVIPAGTVFDTAPIRTTRVGLHVGTSVELDANNTAHLTLPMEDKLVGQWFDEVEDPTPNVIDYFDRCL
jgi:hypothetical protein